VAYRHHLAIRSDRREVLKLRLRNSQAASFIGRGRHRAPFRRTRFGTRPPGLRRETDRGSNGEHECRPAVHAEFSGTRLRNSVVVMEVFMIVTPSFCLGLYRRYFSTRSTPRSEIVYSSLHVGHVT
jgi:hypothetical protein